MLFDHRESESLAMLFIYYFFTHFKYVYGEIGNYFSHAYHHFPVCLAIFSILTAIQVPVIKIKNPLGIDPLEAGNILGEDDDDDEHKVYLEERIEYIPERRASQMIIDFDPKANSYKLLVCYPFLLPRLRFHSCTEPLPAKMRYQAYLKLLCYLNIINIYLK